MKPLFSMMKWSNDNYKQAIQSSLDIDGKYSVMNLPGIGAVIANQLKKEYGVHTIYELMQHVMEMGFPPELTDESKFVLSARCTHYLYTRLQVVE